MTRAAGSRRMPLPPLLSSRPPALRIVLVTIPAAMAGFATGAMLGVSVAAWAIANVLAALGGIGAGFEHDGARDGARRGAAGGLAFGVGLVLADALVVNHRVATIAHPAILQCAVTTIAGALLGALGGALRARAMRQREASAV